MDYEKFIENKAIAIQSVGFEVDRSDLNPMLFNYQKDIVRWALMKGRACIFSDCGSGKTPMQLEWADQIVKHTDGSVIILAPLAVCEQTKREGAKFGIEVNVCESQSDVITPGINITNYEKLEKFNTSKFVAVVLDESSILKAYTGKVRTQILDAFQNTDYRLACTATPAPNDYMEFGNHAEFVGSMTRSEMLAMYFVHDGGQTSKWRLKGHAKDIFWQWMASWAVVLKNPSDLGYTDERFTLPDMHISEIIVDGEKEYEGTLTLTERRDARRESLDLRCQAAADLVNNSSEQWLVWCDLNAESELLTKLCNDAVEIKGSDKNEHKVSAMYGFSDESIRVLVTKPSIAGFGMNWQQCHNMIFVGLSDSYEQFYQATRRCWRFGQTKDVNAYIIISAREGCVMANVQRKEADAKAMQESMIEYTKDITKKELQKTCRITTEYNADSKMRLPRWEEFE